MSNTHTILAIKIPMADERRFAPRNSSLIINRGYLQQHQAAFTLVELLVIISIIVLLIGILVPALTSFQRNALRAKSFAIVNIIDGACKYYYDDFGDYPPSHIDNGVYQNWPDSGNWYGGQLIVLFLTGYAPDIETKGDPFGDNDDKSILEDDGKDGFGFRLARRGKVYGPYNGTEKLDVKKDFVYWDNGPQNYSAPYAFFADAFDGNILYYRFDKSSSSYHASDNIGDEYIRRSGGNGPDPASIPSIDINYYAKDSSDRYYRSDFILISKGANRKMGWQNYGWDPPREGDSDDITNFFTQ